MPDSKPLNIIDRGRGFPIVLLHAFPVDSRMWAGQVDELSGHYRVIAPDFPGFGKSPSTGSFTVPSLAETIHKLLGEMNVLPCVLGGCSMGGYVAMDFAVQFPGDLRGLILVDTKAAGDSAEQKENRNRMIEVAKTKGSGAIAQMMIGKMLAPDAEKNRQQVARSLRSMMEACPPDTIANALAALRDRPDMSDALPRVKIPTLVIVGEQDTLTPPDISREIQKLIPGSELALIPGAGHMAALEQPTQVSRVMGEFLGRVVEQ